MAAVLTSSLGRAGPGGGGDGGDGDGRDWSWLAIPAGFLAGSIPFSNLMARSASGVDLRQVGTGTVSGTGLYEVAGFGPLAAAGILEVAKGAVGPALAGRDRPVIAALAAGAAVCGHNWSPWLRGAGGRGLSPAIGALLVVAPAGAATLLGGMAIGRVVRQTAIGSLIGDVAAGIISRQIHGREAGWAATAVTVPIFIKRVLGNARPTKDAGRAVYLWRLVLDRDVRTAPAGVAF